MKNFFCALEFGLQLPSIEHGLVFFLVPCGNQNHYTDEVIYATNMNGLLLLLYSYSSSIVYSILTHTTG